MKIEKVWLDNEYVYVKTDLGHIIGSPLAWFPRLLNATIAQRNNFEISPFGIHWQDVDEDLSLEGFFDYKREAVYEEHFGDK